MSERSERIEAAIDSEWRTTREIVERAGYPGDPNARYCAVQRLEALHRQGRVEMKPLGKGPSYRAKALWRLSQ